MNGDTELCYILMEAVYSACFQISHITVTETWCEENHLMGHISLLALSGSDCHIPHSSAGNAQLSHTGSCPPTHQLPRGAYGYGTNA